MPRVSSLSRRWSDTTSAVENSAWRSAATSWSCSRAAARDASRPPDQHVHAERGAVAGHDAADPPEAPDSQRLAREQVAHAVVRRIARALQAALLPHAVLEVGDVLRQAPHRAHQQRPCQLGRGSRRAGAVDHRHATFGAGVDVDVRAGAAGLGDELQLRQLVQQVLVDPRALANQDQGFGVRQAHAELPGALDGIVEDLDLVPGEQREAIELANGVLVVVEDRDLHRPEAFEDAETETNARRGPPTGRPDAHRNGCRPMLHCTPSAAPATLHRAAGSDRSAVRRPLRSPIPPRWPATLGPHRPRGPAHFLQHAGHAAGASRPARQVGSRSRRPPPASWEIEHECSAVAVGRHRRAIVGQ